MSFTHTKATTTALTALLAAAATAASTAVASAAAAATTAAAVATETATAAATETYQETALGLFKKGGPIMWPILLVSFVALAVIIERFLFLSREKVTRKESVAGHILERVEKGDIEGALRIGEGSKDFIARILVNALAHRALSLEDAFAQASSRELSRYQQGLPILDTCITASPLLGLLGTVTGMYGTFQTISSSADIAAGVNGIMGGVGEALIATTCGLAIAVVALLPFNILNARVEQVRSAIAGAANALNLATQKAGGHLSSTLNGSGAGI
jgi:biopolymer transport protein ExbB